MICDRAPKIDIRQMARHLPETITIGDISVRVVSTPCHLGGARQWFLCPCCARRCAILYPIICRRCRNGRYLSELKSPHDRKFLRAIRMRQRLGQVSGGIIAPIPGKPERMRWHTYFRRRAEIVRLEGEIWEEEHRRKR